MTLLDLINSQKKIQKDIILYIFQRDGYYKYNC